jgi:predicted peptidase
MVARSTSCGRRALLLALATCGCRRKAPPRPFVAPGPGFFGHEEQGQRYMIYRPADWTPERRWPVIVFLHGSSEQGLDGVAPVHSGLGLVVLRKKGAFPFVVVFPQCPPERGWGMPDVDARVFVPLERALREHAGDPRRVYLTGLSLGGYGTWLLGARFPERWAALVPICGGVIPNDGRRDPHMPFGDQADPPAAVARALGRIPIWAFHGSDDQRVPVERSREVVAAVRRAGGDVRYTEYPDVRHNSWDRAYAEPGLFPWLLQQRRPGPL